MAAHSKDLITYGRAAKTYLLQAHPKPELLKLAAVSRLQALKLSPSWDNNRDWFLVTAALTALRDGQPAETEPLLTEALEDNGGNADEHRVALVFRDTPGDNAS